MTARPLSLALLVSLSACGSGRLVPSGRPEPAPGPAEPTAVAPPPPAAEPAAQPAPPQPAPAAAPAPQPAPAAGYAPYGAGAVQIRRIGQWSASGITAPARLIIREDSSYARLWSELGAGARPSVDFTRDIVIAAAAGQRSTGGYSIAVERVTRSGPGLAIEVVESTPGAGCSTAQTVTQPVDVVVVAAADVKTWSFSDQSREAGCK